MSIKIQFSPAKPPVDPSTKSQENQHSQDAKNIQLVAEKVANVKEETKKNLFKDTGHEIHPHPTSENSAKRQKVTEFKVPLPTFKPSVYIPTPGAGKLERNVNTLTIPEIPKPITSIEKHHRSAPPPTPTKPTPFDRKSNFEKLNDLILTGSFKYQGKLIKKTIGEGTYCRVYEVGADSDLVLKAFHGRKMGFGSKVLMKCLLTAAQNYKDVKDKLGLPVAIIHNIETVTTDLFVIQEKITTDIDYLNPDQMRQINQFFIKSLENNIAIDLQPGNLKVKNETVVLIDFIEDNEHTVESMIPFICKAWYYRFREDGLSRKKALDLLSQLIERANQTYPYVERAWLEQILK